MSDIREAMEHAIETATMPWGKYKGRVIVECKDPDYWKWVRGLEAFKSIGKIAGKAVKRASWGVEDMAEDRRKAMMVLGKKS